jgi:two-component system response regulator (stage 0 sporulation protein F)
VSARGQRKVVVADDEPEIRELLAEYLESHGWEVFGAVNGLEALLHVKRQHPAAVVLDLNMPRLGGLDALKRIRAFDPAIGVVVVSANVDDAVRRQAEALGATAVLDKPLDLARLLAALGGDAAPPPQPEPSPLPTSEAAIDTRPAGQRTVLVADDDPEIREMLEEFFVGKGYQVRIAVDGVGAVRELTGRAPDVVLLDIEMPGLSGVDALPTLKALAPGTAVIMVSGTTDVEVARRTLAAGAFDYATKPVDLARLLESVETAIAMGGLGL